MHSVFCERWNYYFLAKGQNFYIFWDDFLKSTNRNVLFVLGAGFDPRAAIAIETLYKMEGQGKRDLFLIDFDEGHESPSRQYDASKRENIERIKSAVANRGFSRIEKVAMWSTDSRPHRIGSRRINQAFSYTASDLTIYSDIVLDVSALPKTLFFPLMTKIMQMADEAVTAGKVFPNLHVIVASSPSLDEAITSEGIDEEASPVTGFSSDLDRQAIGSQPKVWLPILRSGAAVHLQRIYEKVRPDEVAPVVPWPSKEARLGDELLTEYRQYLYDNLGVEPRNTLYVPESNPFGVYRQIYQASLRYHNALRLLGGSTTVISALSSKLSSVGALLAAYKLKQENYSVSVVHVEAQGYNCTRLELPTDIELVSMWITGESYDK